MKYLPAVVAATLFPLTACASEPTVATLYEEVNSAVVGIFTVSREIVLDSESNNLNEVVSKATGTGVVINEHGNVITAAHLVQTADHLGVEYVDGTRTLATVVASDPFQDLALLEVHSTPEWVRPVSLADSDLTRVGERVFIVGAPYGFQLSLSGGYISGRHELDGLSLATGNIEYFQTDAAINYGTSGAPLFDMNGDVIGIASMIVSHSGGSEGLGFAVTSNTAKRVLFEVPSFWSGLSGVMVSDEIAELLNVPQPAGYAVQRVAARSPADQMQIQAGRIPILIGDVELLVGGDILLTIDGIEFSPANILKIQKYTAELQTGQSVTIQVLRAGAIIDLVGIL